jgi:polysaccharide export outer membrane protein
MKVIVAARFQPLFNKQISIRCTRTLLVMCLASLVSCASDTSDSTFPSAAGFPADPPSVRRDGAPVFRVGDRLELFVEEDTTFNGMFEVRPEGYVFMPKLGRVPVVGLTRDGAERRVKEYLQKSQLTTATVFVELVATGVEPVGSGAGQVAGQPKIKVYVTGKVTSPGLHSVPVFDGRNPGVYEVLLITGGALNFGNYEKVQILRLDGSGRRKKQIVDVKAIQAGKAPDVQVGEGDIIHVPEKVFGF